MIITRAPLRITLGGGGTDVPAYYEKHGGICIAAAIDKYVYIMVNRTFAPGLIVKYSKVERVAHAGELEHPIIREAMALCGLTGDGMEIASFADIPAGTGLGSSGAFTVALLKALHVFKREIRTEREIADEACEIEIGRLHEPIGKQDQYIAAFGGVTLFTFGFGNVLVKPVPMTEDLADSLLLFFTGYSRSASAVLQSENAAISVGDESVIRGLHAAQGTAVNALDAIETGDTEKLGGLFDAHWQAKRARPGMSNEGIDAVYALGMANGAIGGKLVGAGGGGFLLFVASDKAALRKAMKAGNNQEVRFKIDYEGVKLISL